MTDQLSPSLRDKIRLFEGKNIRELRTNARPHSNRVLCNSTSVRPSFEKENSTPEMRRRKSTSSELLLSLPLPLSSIPPIPPIPISLATLPDGTQLISPRKWNVISNNNDNDNDSRNNNTSNNNMVTTQNKGKERMEELPPSPRDRNYNSEKTKSPTINNYNNNYNHDTPAVKSPRKPTIEKYEEEVIKLKRLNTEEKGMVKALIKLTTKKNKTIDNLEASMQREREGLAAQVESEKAILSNRLRNVDLELSNKSRELSVETMRNNDLMDKILKLERDRQQIRLALATSKRESQQCKINYDAELNKKNQSLTDVAVQLTALACLRQSMNCVVCEEKIALTVLQPCRHMVLCAPCSGKVTKCPMCRVDIRCKFEVYNNWVI